MTDNDRSKSADGGERPEDFEVKDGPIAPDEGDQGPGLVDWRESDSAEEPPKRGTVRFQDPETTQVREPSVAEQRARRKAIEREREEEIESAAQSDQVERKSRTRRRILIGGGVTVGVVALVATWYAASTPDEVTARCVDPGDVVAQAGNAGDDYCDENYVTSHGGHYSNGYYFIPYSGGFTQYHYYYGGNLDSRGHVSGGTITRPSSGTTVKSNSGKTVQRGGFGVKGGGKSGGS